jgi:hypothetical protein
VAKTFSGIVTYGVCLQPNVVDINFSRGVYFKDRAPIPENEQR